MEKILLETGPSPKSLHRVEDFNHCGVLYALKWRRGHGSKAAPPFPSNAPALVRGSIGHVGLAHIYARMWCQQNGQDPERFYPPIEAMAELVRRREKLWGELGKQMLEKCIPAIDRYETAYSGEATTYKVISVEESFEVTLPGGVSYTQRPDLILMDARGRYVIFDHKIVGRYSPNVPKRYTLSAQFLGYSVLGPLLFKGAPCSTVINFIAMEDDAPRFVRIQPEPAPDAVRRFPKMVADTLKRMEALAAEDRDPMDYQAAFSELACTGPYGQCPAFEICRWGGHPPADTAGFELVWNTLAAPGGRDGTGMKHRPELVPCQDPDCTRLPQPHRLYLKHEKDDHFFRHSTHSLTLWKQVIDTPDCCSVHVGIPHRNVHICAATSDIRAEHKAVTTDHGETKYHYPVEKWTLVSGDKEWIPRLLDDWKNNRLNCP